MGILVSHRYDHGYASFSSSQYLGEHNLTVIVTCMKSLEAHYRSSDLYDDDVCGVYRYHVNHGDWCGCGYDRANHDQRYGGERANYDGYDDCDHRDDVNHDE